MRNSKDEWRRRIVDENAPSTEGSCRSPWYCHDYAKRAPEVVATPAVKQAIGKMEEALNVG